MNHFSVWGYVYQIYFSRTILHTKAAITITLQDYTIFWLVWPIWTITSENIIWQCLGLCLIAGAVHN